MQIGVPKEVKSHEYRVGLTPESAGELTRAGHTVNIETNAGIGVGFSDDQYRSFGVCVVDSAIEVFKRSDLIVKVKEPQPQETKLLNEQHTLFTFLHLAPDNIQTQALLDSGCAAIAYETITSANGGLPLLTPMSEVAGRLSVQMGASALQKNYGGSGVLLGGVPGVSSGKVVVIGGGVVGTNAIRRAIGRECSVTVIDKSLDRLRQLDTQYGGMLSTRASTEVSIAEEVTSADVVIGAVLIPGGAAPKLVKRTLLSSMRPGSVLVDVAIDQGGCFETSRPTTHQDPTYEVDGVMHYCVTNMPGAVPRTSTLALNNATLPYILNLANNGVIDALRNDAHFRNGLNVYRGSITYKEVSVHQNRPYVGALELLG